MKYAHPIARARERYALDLTPDDFDDFKRLVRTHRPEAVPLSITHDGAILVAIRYAPPESAPQWLATAWRGGDILTILPARSLLGFGARLSCRVRELRRLGREEEMAWSSAGHRERSIA